VLLRHVVGEGLRVLPRPLDLPRPRPRVSLHVAVRLGARPPAVAGPDARRRHRCGARHAGGRGVTVTTPRPADTEDIPGVTRRHRLSDLYHERTNFQFIQHSKRWLIVSSTLIILSLVIWGVRGLNFGIDFRGGTQWSVQMASGKHASVSEVRDIL